MSVPIHAVNAEMYHRISGKLDMLVVQEEKSEITKVIMIHPLRLNVQKFMAIHAIVVEVFQSEPQRWTIRHCHPYSRTTGWAKTLL